MLGVFYIYLQSKPEDLCWKHCCNSTQTYCYSSTGNTAPFGTSSSGSFPAPSSGSLCTPPSCLLFLRHMVGEVYGRCWPLHWSSPSAIKLPAVCSNRSSNVHGRRVNQPWRD